MLGRLGFFTVIVELLAWLDVFDELVSGLWVLSIGEPVELLFGNVALQSPFFGQTTIPLPGNGVLLGIIVLLCISELVFVVCLACPEARALLMVSIANGLRFR